MRRFGGKFDEFKSSIKFDSRFLPRFRVFSGVKFDEAKLTMLKFTCKFYSRVFAPSGLNLADVLQKPSNFAADFWQNSHFENAGKFTSEFLMLANLNIAKFMSRKFK